MTSDETSKRAARGAHNSGGARADRAVTPAWPRRPGTAKVHVVTPLDSAEVVAYYAWSMASFAIAEAVSHRVVGLR